MAAKLNENTEVALPLETLFRWWLPHLLLLGHISGSSKAEPDRDRHHDDEI